MSVSGSPRKGVRRQNELRTERKERCSSSLSISGSHKKGVRRENEQRTEGKERCSASLSRSGSPRKGGRRGEGGERGKILEILGRTGRQVPEQTDFPHGRLKHYGPNKVVPSDLTAYCVGPHRDLEHPPAAQRLRRWASLADCLADGGQGGGAPGQGALEIHAPYLLFT